MKTAIVRPTMSGVIVMGVQPIKSDEPGVRPYRKKWPVSVFVAPTLLRKTREPWADKATWICLTRAVSVIGTGLLERVRSLV